jgi:hypothetical protein
VGGNGSSPPRLKIILFNSVMYICNKCFIKFTRKDKYIQHIQNMHLKLGKEYKCKYCGKEFKIKSYYDKHMKETCIRYKEFEQNIIKQQLEKISAIKIENEIMKKEIFNTIHTLPRYSIINGKIINVECDYIEYDKQKNIVTFGKEVLDHLKKKFMRLMIMEPELGIVNLVRMIHFNDAMPQNRNLFLKDEENIYIFQKKNWLKIPRNDVIQNLIASKKDIMDDWYEDFLEKKIIDQKYINKYEIFSHDLDRYINHIVFTTEYNTGLYIPKLMYERIDKMIYILLLNNKKIETKYTPNDNICVDMSDEL